MKYTDPSGDIAFLAVVAIVGVVSGTINLATNWKNVNSFGDGLYYFGVGTAVGAGATVGGAALAPVLGTGAIAGVALGSSAGFVTGFANTIYTTNGDFNSALKSGLGGAIIGGVTGGLIAGAVSGIRGANFWTGVKPGYSAPSWNFKDVEKITTKEFWKYGKNLKQTIEVGNPQRLVNPKEVSKLAKNHDIYASQKAIYKSGVDKYYNQMVNNEFNPNSNTIALFKEGNKYVISEGHHRIAAALQYGLDTGNYSYVNSLVNGAVNSGKASSYGIPIYKFPTSWVH